jgi:DnaJ-domain-containing protein 1
LSFKKNLFEFGSDLLAITKLIVKDLKIAPPRSQNVRGFKTMFKDSISKGKGAGSAFKSFKEDIDAIKHGRFQTAREEDRSEAASPAQSDTKPRAYWLDRLGLKPEATKDQIREAYRNAAMRYHPDKNKSSWAASRFMEIQEAWEHVTCSHP